MTPTEPQPARSRGRRVVAGLLTTFAAVLLFLALSTPQNVSRLPEGSNVAQAFVRIPIEALLGIAVLLVLPPRLRRMTAIVGGVLLGLLTMVKVIDMGFFAALSRPFNPVLDWVLFDDGYNFVRDGIGQWAARLAVVALVLLLLGVPVLMAWVVLRLTRLAERHRTAASRTVLALSAAWIVLALLGSHFVSTVFISSDTAVTLARDTAAKIPEGIRDKREFAAAASVDRFRDIPSDRLLSKLAGKDVIFAFVESYGRSAVEDPDYATGMTATLTAGNEQLAAAGYGARSGWLTSPTAGGGSWLAHATFHSGLWVDNEQRYRTLMASSRTTLTSAFGRGDWRVVGIEPGLTYAWPEGRFYGFDQIYGKQQLGYRGPNFSWATMPDQYSLHALETFERSKAGRSPLMAEVTFVSSHTPWAPVPEVIGWDQVGDGTVYGPMIADDPTAGEVWKDDKSIRAAYLRSVQYSVDTLVSYVREYGDDDLVLVFLGDHQPSPVAAGDNATRDVPISIVTRDEAVLAATDPWQWTPGLKPGPSSPALRMDAFRDRFLTTFSGP